MQHILDFFFPRPSLSTVSSVHTTRRSVEAPALRWRTVWGGVSVGVVCVWVRVRVDVREGGERCAVDIVCELFECGKRRVYVHYVVFIFGDASGPPWESPLLYLFSSRFSTHFFVTLSKYVTSAHSPFPGATSPDILRPPRRYPSSYSQNMAGQRAEPHKVYAYLPHLHLRRP